MPEAEAQQSSKNRARNEPKPRQKTPSLENAAAEHASDSVALDFQTGNDFSPSAFQRHAALLGDSHLSHSMYTRQRAALVQQLQRDYGNQYVQRLVQEVRRRRTQAVQPKLTVGAAGDAYEREADQVAKRVVGELNASPGRESVQRQDGAEEELRMKPVAEGQVGAEGGDPGPAVEQAIQQASGRGQPLPEDVRAPMEGAFGADFSGVRVHTGSEADALNQSLTARAFTAGQDIFFRQGEYNPGSSSGKEVLAHELTHVVQQGGIPTVIHRWEGKEHKIAGNMAKLEFPYRGKVNTNMTALRSSPRKDTKDPHGNTVADLRDDVEVLAVAAKGAWVRVLVQSGTATGGKGETLKADQLTGYISSELITRDSVSYDEKLKMGPWLTVSYGDLVAIGGDHFEQFQDVLKEAGTLAGAQRLQKLIVATDSERIEGGEYKAPEYESEDTVSKEYAERYKSLALDNVSHFLHGGTAMQTWQENHRTAVLTAFDGGKQGESAKLERATAMNGFADHFLTDSFSAGHVRVPRQEIISHYQLFAFAVFDNMLGYLSTRLGSRIYELLRRDYRRVRMFGGEEDRQQAIATVRAQIDQQIANNGGIKKVRSEFGLYLAGLFSKILHDQDNRQGLKVVSQRHPEGWMAYGDEQMQSPKNAKNLEYMVEAVEASKQDIVEAFNIGLDLFSRYGPVAPESAVDAAMKSLESKVGPPFKALEYTPYPDPTAKPIASWQWGQLDGSVKRDILALISKYLTTDIQGELLSALPEQEEVEVKGPNVIARPREAATDILNELLRDPIAFLEAAFGKPASEEK